MTHYFPDYGDDEPHYNSPKYDGSYEQPLIDDDIDAETLIDPGEKRCYDADYHYYLYVR